MRKLMSTTLILFITSQLLLAQLSGTRNVPSDNYPNFQAIVDSLNLMEINTGGIIFEVSGDQVFNHSPLLITGTGNSDSPITIQWDETGAKPIINFTGTSANYEAGITLSGTDYFTIKGIAIVAENELLEYGIFLSNASINNGCQHNVFQNLDITLDKTNPNQVVGVNVVTADDPTLAEGIHADNKFFNNTVQNCIMGYNFDSGTGDVSFMGFDNEVGTINNGVSLITDISLCGVYLKGQNGAKVHHTQITNLERIGTGSTAPAAIATTSNLPNDILTGDFEIHDNIIDNHHSAFTSIIGFYLNARKSNHLVYNNIINNLSATGGGTNTATGIMLFGTSITATIYNNMISAIASPASAVSSLPATRGIDLRSFGEAHVYYNSVQLNYTATNVDNSSAALVVNNDDDPITLKNNIFINTSTLAPQSTSIATAFYNKNTTFSNIANESSNNLYYSGEPSISHPIFYAYSSSSPIIGETLVDYQDLVSYDQTAFTGQVNFKDDSYLHVESTDTLVRNKAIVIDSPIAITEDIDGQVRSIVNPDLGADELPSLLPTTAVNPSPADSSTEIPLSLEKISWDYFENDLFATPAGFKIYLNDSDDFSETTMYWLAYEEGQINFFVNMADMMELENSTNYFWKVVPTAVDQDGQEAEEVQTWSFTTENYTFDYPNLSVCVSPTDGQTEVDVDLEMLEWNYTLNADYAEPFGFKVYFGTNSDLGENELLPFVEYEPDEENYSIIPSQETLASETIYYWKVVPVAQSETGVENPDAANWQFTTEQINSSELIKSTKTFIYPNPVSNFVSINLIEECDITIYSISGENIFSKTNQNSLVIIPVNKLKSGVYFLTIQNDESVLTERFIVE